MTVKIPSITRLVLESESKLKTMLASTLSTRAYYYELFTRSEEELRVNLTIIEENERREFCERIGLGR